MGEDQPWSAEMQRLHKTHCAALWELAIKEEAEAAEGAGALPTLTRNPWRKARARKERRPPPDVLTKPEIRALLRHPEIRGTPLAAFLGCAALAGLRQQEIAHLRGDVDVRLGVAKPSLKIQAHDAARPRRPKTENSYREVPIGPSLVALIEAARGRGVWGRSTCSGPSTRRTGRSHRTPARTGPSRPTGSRACATGGAWTVGSATPPPTLARDDPPLGGYPAAKGRRAPPGHKGRDARDVWTRAAKG